MKRDIDWYSQWDQHGYSFEAGYVHIPLKPVLQAASSAKRETSILPKLRCGDGNFQKKRN